MRSPAPPASPAISAVTASARVGYTVAMEALTTLYIDKESHKFSAAHFTIFSAAEREAYQRDGFLKVEDFLSPEQLRRLSHHFDVAFYERDFALPGMPPSPSRPSRRRPSSPSPTRPTRPTARACSRPRSARTRPSA